MKLSRKLFILLLMTFLIFAFVACKKSIEFNLNFVSDDEIVHTISTSGNEAITLPPSPTKDGYMFDGWYWDKDVWEMPFTASSLLNVPLSSDMKVYAKWLSYEETLPKYTVSFETNGGTSVSPILTSVIEEAPSTKKDYNSFVGWYTDESMQESTRVTFPFTPSSDVTLYAKWTVDFTEGLQMTLQTSTNTYFVTGYTGGEADIVIPATYKGLDVTGINARAFEGNSTIRTVIIPNSVITVGLGAFSECYNLISVDMSDQVQLLGASAFSNCIKLEKIDLPNTLQNIGGEAFFGCTALKELYLSNELGNIGTNIIRGCNSLTKLTLPGRIALISLVGDTNDNIPQNLKEIQIAEGSETVCANMLYNCAQIENLTIPSSVKSIENNAFYGLKNLTQINLNSTALDDLAKNNQVFSYIGQDTKGATVNIGNNVTRIPAYLFYPSTDSTHFCNITSIVFEETSVCESIGEYAFYGCEALKNLVLPDSIKNIGTGALNKCSSLKSLIIGNGISTMPSDLLYGCSSLESLTIPFVGASASATKSSSETLFGYIFGTKSYTNSIAITQKYNSSSSGEIVFNLPNSLHNVTIVSGNILYGTFSYCTNLKNITLPGDLTNIGECAFLSCTNLSSVVIPDSVTSIGRSAFSGCKSLRSIELPNNIKSIERNMFYGCTNLSSIIIPNSVTSIGEYAFNGCTSMANITIPDSVTSIGYNAFQNCNSLTNVYISDIASWCNIAFGDSYANPLLYAGNLYINGELITELVIPNTVTSIKSYAFYDGDSLTSISIPDSVTSIGSYAFYTCDSLTSVTIGDGVTSIGNSAFRGCTALEEINFNAIAIDDLLENNYVFSDAGKNGDGIKVTIGKEVTKIPSYLFYPHTSYSPKITIVVFEESSVCESVGKYAFENCTSLTSIVIPDSVTSIGGSAFCNCTSLTSIVIPDSVTSIGESAFYYCTGLTSVYISDIASWCNIAFGDSYANPLCYAKNLYINGELITELVIPDTVTEIKNYTFNNCTNLTSVTFEERSACESVGSMAFTYCTSLTNIEIPNSVTRIGNSAFNDCIKLTSLTIPDSVTSIGNNAFYNCPITEAHIPAIAISYIPQTDLQTIYITKGALPSGAFRDCTSLTSVTIGEGVTSIGRSAFYNCSSLTSVYISDIASWCNIAFRDSYANPLCYAKNLYINGELVTELVIPNTVTEIKDYAFYGCDSLTSVTIADSVTSIGSHAFYNCSSLTSIYISEIPNTVTEIKDYAFYGCDSLTSISIPDSVTSIGSYAFYTCDSLTNVTIGEGVTSIGNSAFRGCTALEEINFNAKAMDDLSSDNYVFYNAGKNGDGIKVTIDKEVTKIPSYLFYPHTSYSPKITIVVFEESSVCENIGSYAFSGCSGLTNISMPDSVTSIGSYAFSGCSGLTNISMPDSVTSIGSYAFSGCSSLTSIPMPDSVTSIGDYAFNSCTSLTSIYISDIVSWCNIAFGNSHANPLLYAGNLYINGELVTELVIPDTVNEIKAYAFYGCENLTSVTIGNNVTSIGDGAFYDSTSLTSVTIGDGVTNIGNNAFYNCPITEAHIPTIAISYISKADLQTLYIIKGDIPSNAFSGLAGLTSVTIGEGVTSIGKNAFKGCSSLTSVTIGDSVTSIGSYALTNCPIREAHIPAFAISYISKTDLQTVHITKGDISSNAFRDCTSLTNVTIGDSVTGIGSYAFGGCTLLTYNQYDNAYYLGNEDNPYVVLIKAKSNSIISCTISENTKFIYDDAFYGCTSLTSITVGDSVTSIGECAFYNCTNLTNATIGDSVTSIGNNAFENCTGLTSVTIGKGITSIDNYAFSGCTALEEINFNAIAMGDLNYGNYVFSYAGENGDGIKVTIGKEVTKIPACLFNPYNDSSYSPKITSVEFEEGSVCESIGNQVFYCCYNMSSIVIPDSVTSIGERAFYYCKSLTNVTIGKGVTSIGVVAFDECYALTEINFNAIAMDDLDKNNHVFSYAGQNGDGIKVTIGKEVTKIPARLFNPYEYDSYSPKITSVEFEEGSVCESVGSAAFRGCSSLTSIVIPDSVTSIGSHAFFGCTSLTNVYISDIASWCNIAFGDYYANPLLYAGNLYINGELVTELVIPNSVTSIKTYAFYGCTGLTSITIPDSVTSIGSSAFDDCIGLTNATIGDSVTSIGDNAFQNCNSLTNVTIGEGVTSIDNYAFSGCTSLTNVYISDIASWCNIAFGDYYANPLLYAGNLYINGELVTELVIPNSVTSIKTYAFYGCTGLTSITVGDSVTSIGECAFYNCTNLTNATIGDSVTSIGDNAFQNCNSLTNVTIGEGVTSIGNYAFSGCTALTEINFNAIAMGDLNYGNYVFSYAGENGDGIKVTIGKEVTKIPACLFNPCDNSSYSPKITIVVFEESSVCESVGKYAFENCTSLTSIVIPDSVTSIGESAFYGCISMTSATIPDSVTSIGESVFYGCTSLTSVTIGKGVTSIGVVAFYDCTSLTSVTFENPNGWYVIMIGYDETSKTNVNLSDASSNATYLKSTYLFYYWYKK